MKCGVAQRHHSCCTLHLLLRHCCLPMVGPVALPCLLFVLSAAGTCSRLCRPKPCAASSTRGPGQGLLRQVREAAAATQLLLVSAVLVALMVVRMPHAWITS